MGEVTVFEWRSQIFRTKDEAVRAAKADILRDIIAYYYNGANDLTGDIGSLTLPQFAVAVITADNLDVLERLTKSLRRRLGTDGIR